MCKSFVLLHTASSKAGPFKQALWCQNRPFMILRRLFHPSQVEHSHTHISASKGSKYLHPIGIMVNEKFVRPLHADKLSSLIEWKEGKQIPTVPSPS